MNYENSKTSIDAPENQKSLTEELLRKTIDERMAEDRFIGRRELHNVLAELNEEQEEPISSARVSDLLKGVDFKEGLILEENTRKTLVSRGLRHHRKDETLDDLKKWLGVFASTHCEVPPTPEELDSIARAVIDGEAADEEVGILLSDVQAEKVMWLWDRRVPLAKLTLIEGDPDHGKSVITCDISARVTRGNPFPLGDLGGGGSVGDLGILGGVVMLNAEDAPGDTIRPRMEAADADLEKVCVLPAMLPDGKGEERLFSIPKDVPIIERAIKQVDAKLVVIDPLSAFMQGDPNKDSDVRKALTPLSKMAERTGVAVVVVRHFNKNVDTNALYRGGGSIGIVGAARSAMAVALHPDDEDQRVLVPQKGNLSKKAPAISYAIVEAENGYPRIEWGESFNLNAQDVLNPSRTLSKVEEAAEWLTKHLADGSGSADSVVAAGKEAGLSKRTLERAKPKAGVESYREGDTWYWHLPKNANVAKDANLANGAKVA